MKISKTTAQNIVNRAMKVIGKSVNVMDERGIIIASGNAGRLGQRHPGALLALRDNKIVEIDRELAEQWRYEALPGINLPITYLGKPLGVVGISGVPAEVRPYAELVKMTAELIIEQGALLAQEHWNRRYQEEFLLEAIRGSAKPADLKRRAAALGLDVSGRFAAVVIKCRRPEEFLLTHRLVAYLEQPKFKQWVVMTALDEITVLKALPAAQEADAILLQAMLPEGMVAQDFHMAAGAAFSGADALHMAYQTAASTLAYAQTRAPKEAHYFYRHYRLPALLAEFSGSWQAQELRRPIEALRAKDSRQIWLKTLRHYFDAEGDVPRAAQTLFVHPNTLRYRLAQIEQITGLSLHKTDEQTMLYLGMLLHED